VKKTEGKLTCHRVNYRQWYSRRDFTLGQGSNCLRQAEPCPQILVRPTAAVCSSNLKQLYRGRFGGL